MRYIEKIEISKFRSFGENVIIEPLDYNVFSGSNDSGKSNILKALNLFFNNQTDFDTPYNSDADFNKWFRDNKIRGQRNIKIKITFSKGSYQDRDGINNGFIAEKIYSDAGGTTVKFYKLDNTEIKESDSTSYKRANNVVSGKMKFLYIPTVRDIKFRGNIQRQIENIAEATDGRYKNKNLQKAFDGFEKGLIAQLKDLKEMIATKMHTEINTTINFGSLLESMGFNTRDNIKISKRGKRSELQEISLKSRGEGIQMQFFSFLLWFISKNDKKHNYIWGYEEPEVAFEMKRQFELADVFQKTFTKDVQIFLTTHSPAFAFSEYKEQSRTYRVSYENDVATRRQRLISKIYQLEKYYDSLPANTNNDEKLKREIWGLNIQRLSFMLGSSLDDITSYRHIGTDEIERLREDIKSINEEKQKIESDKIKIQEVLSQTYPKKILICEDEGLIRFWNDLLYKNSMRDVIVYPSRGCTNDNVEIAIKHLRKTKNDYQPKVFRQLDGDGFSDELKQMVELKKKEKNTNGYGINNYCVKYLPVNEMENFGILMDNEFSEDFVRNSPSFLKIHNAFTRTTEDNCNKSKKLFNNDRDKNKFNSKDLILDQPNNILRNYPGKDIKTCKRRFNPISIITNAQVCDYPQELKDYLQCIKGFFDSANVPNQ